MTDTNYQQRVDAVNQLRQAKNLPPVTWRCEASRLEFHFGGNWFGCNDEAALTTLARYPYWERDGA